MPDNETSPTPTEAALREGWAEAFRVERARRRLTQADVAALAGMAAPTVAKAEDGRGSLDSFLAIARTLGIDLFEGAS